MQRAGNDAIFSIAPLSTSKYICNRAVLEIQFSFILGEFNF